MATFVRAEFHGDLLRGLLDQVDFSDVTIYTDSETLLGGGAMPVPGDAPGEAGQPKRRRKAPMEVGTLHPRGKRTFETRDLRAAWGYSAYVIREEFKKETEGVFHLNRVEKCHKRRKDTMRYTEAAAYRVWKRLTKPPED